MQIEIIYGPPGTGKTTTLLNILSKELKTYSIEEIAYVSFTKEGVRQGKERAHKECNLAKNKMEYFRTLHSIAFKQANMNPLDVMDKNKYKEFSEIVGMKFTGYYTEEFRHNDDRYLFSIMLQRNNPKMAKKYLFDLDLVKLKFIREGYSNFKEQNQYYDYTDMIELFNQRNKHLPVKVAIIDEAQDLTTLQWEMILIAFKNCDKIYIAGDDDQAIYEWFGADVKYFLNIKGNIKVLNKSYRLPNKILLFSKKITSLITQRAEKEYESSDENKDGQIIKIKMLKELLPIIKENDETWMFLSRNRYFLKSIESFLRENGIVFRNFNKLSIENEKVKAINVFEKMRKELSFMPNKPEYNFLKKHVKENMDFRKPWYNNFEWSYDELLYYRDIISNKTDLKKVRVRLETIHAVKGDEADNVVLVRDITKQVYLNLQNNPDSEHRVFYVGATRTKKNLYILDGTNKYQYIFY